MLDSQVIIAMKIGIKALNTSPVRTVKRNRGEIDIIIKFGGVSLLSQYYIYADGMFSSEINSVK